MMGVWGSGREGENRNLGGIRKSVTQAEFEGAKRDQKWEKRRHAPAKRTGGREKFNRGGEGLTCNLKDRKEKVIDLKKKRGFRQKKQRGGERPTNCGPERGSQGSTERKSEQKYKDKRRAERVDLPNQKPE